MQISRKTLTDTEWHYSIWLEFHELQYYSMLVIKYILLMIPIITFDIKSFRSHYGPGVDSACNRNEYQEYFLGVKAAGA